MFANVSRVHVQPGKSEEGRTFWQQTMIPTLKQQPGFRSVVVLHDPQSNRGMAVTLWDSQADADAWVNSSALQQATEPARAILIGQPEIEDYNVLLSEPG